MSISTNSYRTQFDYLLNAFEEASQSDDPGEHDYGAKREALFKYVRDLENSSNGPSMPAAYIEHHKGGDNLVWERTKELCTPLYRLDATKDGKP